MNPLSALKDEFEQALTAASRDRNEVMTQQLADLFLRCAAELSLDQIELFDDLFHRLVAAIDTSAKAGLANRLALSPVAPPRLSRLLAFDDSIAVAGPMLTFSELITPEVLGENALTKGQDHLLAISRRKLLEIPVTDILVVRGNRLVALSSAFNPGASFSDFGYAKLVERSEGDDEVAACVGARKDLPRQHLLRLMTVCSAGVRARLESADPLSLASIGKVAQSVGGRARPQRNYDAARRQAVGMKAAGQLNEDAIKDFARKGQFEECVAGFALLCDLPVESVEAALIADRAEPVLIAAKAIGFGWPAAKALLGLRPAGRGLSAGDIEQTLATYSRLKHATALQVLSFQRKRALAGTPRA